MASGDERWHRFSQLWVSNPLATADVFQLPVCPEHNTANWTEEAKKCNKASTSTLHGFKIMTIYFPPDNKNLYIQMEAFLKGSEI